MQFTTNNLKSYLSVEPSIMAMLAERADSTDNEIAYGVLALCRNAWPQLNIEMVMPKNFRASVNKLIRLIRIPYVTPGVVWVRLCALVDKMLYETTVMHANEISLAVDARTDLPKGVMIHGVTQ